MKTYTFYGDPCHGWMKVTRDELKSLGIADKITHYSYQRGEHVYLEEDCDASLFLSTLESQGEKVRIVEKYTNKSSRVRSYESYEYLSEEDEKALADLKTRMMRSRNWDKSGRKRIYNSGLATLKYWQGQYGF